MSFSETILYTNIGGFIGILIFTLLSKGLIKLFNAYVPDLFKSKKKIRKKFSKRNRRLVILKNKYGLAGIAILTPVLLSIPIGVFLNTKYYGHQKISYLYLLISQIAWSFVYTLFYTVIKVSI
jgi:polyferredoxin